VGGTGSGSTRYPRDGVHVANLQVPNCEHL